MLRRAFCKLLLVAIVISSLLALSGVLLAQGRSDQGLERAIEVQETHTKQLMAIPGVVGTAVGVDQDSRAVVKVFTARGGVAGIPGILDGVRVQPVVTGEFYALPKPESPPGKDKKPPKDEEPVDPTARFERPVPIGVSTGNVESNSAGTIGCRATGGGKVYALSNNHVYALENQASDESEVLQPGRYDDGVSPADHLGNLADYVEIDFDGGDNTIDAAIALSSTLLLGNATPSDGYGTPNSSQYGVLADDDDLGLPVQKYGRTTSLTKGIVSDINFIGNIGYSSGTARFVGQIVIYSARGPFIKAGDSGSLLVTDDQDENNYPVGLLFAGNSSGKYAIANPIGDVLGAFGVSIDGK